MELGMGTKDVFVNGILGEDNGDLKTLKETNFQPYWATM